MIVTSRSPSSPGSDRAPVEEHRGQVEPAAAISIPGIFLSHPASSTAPSSRSAPQTVSTESAITSRETSE